jgi:hypothetical protein
LPSPVLSPGRWSSAALLAVSGGIGLLLFAAGLATLAMLPADPSALDVVWRMAATGDGFGLFQTPNNPHHDRHRPTRALGWGERDAGNGRGFWDRLPARWSHDQIRTNLHRALDS